MTSTSKCWAHGGSSTCGSFESTHLPIPKWKPCTVAVATDGVAKAGVLVFRGFGLLLRGLGPQDLPYRVVFGGTG